MQNKNNKYKKHLHDGIMPRRVKALTHKTSLTPPLFIEVHVPD
jgi:hypothetical protein